MDRTILISVIIVVATGISGQGSAADNATIPAIQGAGAGSPMIGAVVKTEGVVTAVSGTMFFVQDPAGDADPLTSDGIAVRAPNGKATVGDLVTVEGRVVESPAGRNALTVTMIAPAVIRKVGTAGMPVPVVLGSGGVTLPTQAIAGTAGSIELFEAMEGMLVSVADAQVVGPTNERFSELWVVANLGDVATGMNSFGGITSALDDQNPERIQIQLSKALKEAYQASVGDTIAEVVGVLHYDFGNFEIVPTKLSPLVPRGPTVAPRFEVTAADLSIGSYNVENLDPRLEDPSLLYDKDDRDDDVGDGRFDAIAAQIVGVLGSPDIVTLQEVQDDDGGEVSSVVSSELTLDTLIDAIDAIDPTAGYEAFALDPVDDEEGGQLGGNIRVAFLYKPERVKPDLEGASRIDGNGFAATRLPLVVDFDFSGETIRLVNVHLSSKGGSDPLYGVVQPPVDASLEARTRQATTILAYLSGEPSLPTVILGDFNSLYFEEPMESLTGGGFLNLTERLPEVERASYVFEGNSQALDHVLVSQDLAGRAELVTFHLNSVVPEAVALSDHDPKLLILGPSRP